MNLMSYVQPRALARHRREREERNARIQRGECPGLSPVRTLADMSPEERARVIAEIQANHAQKQRPAAVAPPRPVARSAEPLPVTAEERAQEVEERADAIQASPEPIPADEAQEEPMLTTIESARNLRAELDNIAQMQAEKRRAALALADELEQEARALREAAGAVAIGVATSRARPPVKPKARRGVGRQPHYGTVRPGTLNERIITLLGDGVHRSAEEIAAALGESHRRIVVSAAAVKLARRGHIRRVGKGVFGRVE